MTFWQWLQKRRVERQRDPDLDMVKHVTEQHEFRLQLLEQEAERIAGGMKPIYHGPNRRQTPRH